VRMAEANQLRKLLDKQLGTDPEARIVLLGDFNDTWDSETMKTIVGEGSMAMWSATSKLSGDLPDIYNKGEYQSMIDFILCSPAMAAAYVDGSFQVVPGSTETTGSDHNPVSVSFRLE
jgi:endonuclease/exonuclease/phosphatase family metal-dependent hydrolase